MDKVNCIWALVKLNILAASETHNISIEIVLNIDIESILNTYIILDFVLGIDYNNKARGI
jgi:hypothetical protein